MYQPVAYHLVFALEPFPAFRAGAASDRAIVRAALAVDVFMRAIDRLANVVIHFVQCIERT